MDLPSRAVFDVLEANGVTEIFHANSVLTSCHYLRARALLSRGTVERRQHEQSPQASDEIDRRMSIWFDVFTDSVDIHSRASNRNNYGPVLFVLDAAIIRRVYTGRIWVTKSNPTTWRGKAGDERWFQSKDELQNGFVAGDFGHMIVFRHCGGELPFGDSLRRIVLDDPDIQRAQDIDLFSSAHGALSNAIAASGLNVAIDRRHCVAACRCRPWYQAHPRVAATLFQS
jgi:hypothetical protein